MHLIISATAVVASTGEVKQIKSNQITMRVLSPMWEVALVKSILQAETTTLYS